MQFKLINGLFTGEEATEILTKMIEIKISFNEEKLAQLTDEVEISAREKRIASLHQDLHEIKTKFPSTQEKISISATVKY